MFCLFKFWRAHWRHHCSTIAESTQIHWNRRKSIGIRRSPMKSKAVHEVFYWNLLESSAFFVHRQISLNSLLSAISLTASCWKRALAFLLSSYSSYSSHSLRSHFHFDYSGAGVRSNFWNFTNRTRVDSNKVSIVRAARIIASI